MINLGKRNWSGLHKVTSCIPSDFDGCCSAGPSYDGSKAAQFRLFRHAGTGHRPSPPSKRPYGLLPPMLMEGRNIMKHRVIASICAGICVLIAGALPAFAASPAPAATLNHPSSMIKFQRSASGPSTAPGPTARSSSPNITFWVIARAEDPVPLTRNSKTIFAKADITGNGGNPTECALGVDLEQYDGYVGKWFTVSHKPMVWGSCAVGRYVEAPYNCTYDPNTQWAYRTHLWVQAIKGSIYSPMAQAYSTNNVLFWCS